MIAGILSSHWEEESHGLFFTLLMQLCIAIKKRFRPFGGDTRDRLNGRDVDQDSFLNFLFLDGHTCVEAIIIIMSSC